MVLPDASVIHEVISENIGRALELSDLERWNIPSGGGLSFQSSYDTEAKELKCIILAKREEKRYYADKDTSDAPPDCYSLDRKQGIGNPGILCEECEHNMFINGQGKECKDRVEVVFIKDGDLIPSRMSLPTMSIKPFKTYLLSLTSKGKLFRNVITSITITKEKNKAGTAYSRAKFTYLGDMSCDKEVINALMVSL